MAALHNQMEVVHRRWFQAGCEGIVSKNPLYGAISSITRTHRSRNQRVEMEAASLTITPSDPLGKFLLPVPMTLCSYWPKGLSSKGRNASTGKHDNDSTEVNLLNCV